MDSRKRSTTLICMTGLLTAMITLMTAFIFHIPYGSHGGYIHFGDALIYIAAILLPRPYALAAAMIGSGLADLITAPLWLPATVLIKGLMVLCFSSTDTPLLSTRNKMAPLFAAVICIGGYYLAEAILFGSFVTPVLAIPGNMIQSFGSWIIFLVIASALKRINKII